MTKTLQLDLQKRILIVELPRLADYEFINRETKYLKVGNEEINLNISTLSKMEIVCKGDELTEEIAKGLSLKSMNQHWRNLNRKKEDFSDLWLNSALDSFISAIEAEGWYFGENPLGKEPKITEDKYELEREVIDNNPEESIFGDHYADWSMWQEAESKTFHPEKTIIFEIL